MNIYMIDTSLFSIMTSLTNRHIFDDTHNDNARALHPSLDKIQPCLTSKTIIYLIQIDTKLRNRCILTLLCLYLANLPVVLI